MRVSHNCPPLNSCWFLALSDTIRLVKMIEQSFAYSFCFRSKTSIDNEWIKPSSAYFLMCGEYHIFHRSDLQRLPHFKRKSGDGNELLRKIHNHEWHDKGRLDHGSHSQFGICGFDLVITYVEIEP